MKRINWRQLPLWIMLTALWVGGTGCEVADIEKFFAGDVPKDARFVFSFHRVVNYPRGNAQAEQPLRLPDGRTRIIDRYPIMSSHNIVDIAAQPVPGKDGFYRLYFKPDQKGRMMWMQLTAQSQHEPATVLLDGIYFGEFNTAQVGTGSEIWVELPLDVDGARAASIVKYANDNYRYFNNGAKDDQTPFAVQ